MEDVGEGGQVGYFVSNETTIPSREGKMDDGRGELKREECQNQGLDVKSEWHRVLLLATVGMLSCVNWNRTVSVSGNQSSAREG